LRKTTWKAYPYLFVAKMDDRILLTVSYFPQRKHPSKYFQRLKTGISPKTGKYELTKNRPAGTAIFSNFAGSKK
jgi:hypothetical protein